MIGPEWLYHPLGVCAGSPAQIVACQSYNFWSGIEGAAERILGWLPLAALYLRHHNCHVRRCPWPGHPHPDHGRPVCRHHYHDAPQLGPITREGP